MMPQTFGLGYKNLMTMYEVQKIHAAKIERCNHHPNYLLMKKRKAQKQTLFLHCFYNCKISYIKQSELKLFTGCSQLIRLLVENLLNLLTLLVKKAFVILISETKN